MSHEYIETSRHSPKERMGDMATVSETFDKYGAQLFLATVSQPEMLCHQEPECHLATDSP